MNCLAKILQDQVLHFSSNLGEFELFLLQIMLFKDQMTALIQKYNPFLHRTTAISMINLQTLDGYIPTKNKGNSFGKKRDGNNFTEPK